MSVASRCLSRLLASALLFGLCALSACSHLDPFRTEAPPDSPAPSTCAPRLNGKVDEKCDKLSTEVASQYTLHFIEFDDQGWVYDKTDRYGAAPGQLDRAIQHVRKLLDDGNVVRLYVYVHGWRHFADSKDSNVTQFRRFLQRRGQTDQDPNEKVVGIYVGWRGIAIPDVPPFNYLTFWDRKATSERIAQGSVRELFGRLSALYKRAKPSVAQSRRPGQTGQLSLLHTYVIGHSFGASVAFRSMSQSLINDFAGDLDGDVAGITRFIDMVILINPAIEAARFEALRSVAMKREEFCRKLNPENKAIPCDQPRYQGPALAIFGSEADRPNKIAFPVGRSLSNLFEHEISDRERRANRNTIGWDDAYMTHRLTSSDPGECATSLPLDQQITVVDPADGALRFKRSGWKACVKPGMSLQHVATFDGKANYNGPLWNVRVDKSLIGDHGDIWRKEFQDVLDAVLYEATVHPQLAKPDTVPGR